MHVLLMRRLRGGAVLISHRIAPVVILNVELLVVIPLFPAII